MKISSLAFDNNEMIPKTFTCDGDDINPPLVFEDIPEETMSLAVVVTDPDAPGGTWTHWIIWNIDPKIDEIDEGTVLDGATEGLNSGGGQGYQGPCPPNGVHHYHFRLYALDTKLDLGGMSERTDLEEEMIGHTIDDTELVGVYGRKV